MAVLVTFSCGNGERRAGVSPAPDGGAGTSQSGGASGNGGGSGGGGALGGGGQTSPGGADGGGLPPAGGSGGMGAEPNLPPATSGLETCEGLDPVHAREPCPASGCASLECPCDVFPVSLVGCHADLGCLEQVDCARACVLAEESGGVSSILECALDYTPCTTDADCTGLAVLGGEPGFCVTPPGLAGGCASGLPDAPCEDAGDCRSGHCVNDGAGRLLCATGQVGGQCNRAADCSVGDCVLPAAGVLGACSEGRPDEPCYRDGHCLDSGRCVQLSEQSLGTCTPGTSGAACIDDADCVEGLGCALGGIGCTDGSEGSPCASVTDCDAGECIWVSSASGGQCSTGAIGSACVLDDDCQSGICAYSQCSNGAVDDACDSNFDCASPNFCSGFLRCTDGTAGRDCVSGGDCNQFCVQGVCSDGVPGDFCRGGTDCQSGVCTNDMCE